MLSKLLGGTAEKIIGAVGSAVDALHTSTDEKNQFKLKMAEIVSKSLSEAEETARQELKSKEAIITAEAKGDSWLQRNWRPLTMIWFSVLVGAYWFGYTPVNLSADITMKLFDIIQLGLGGYVIGRSAEKIAPSIAEALTKR